jgi:multiple sugar transport system permease protein
MLKRKHIAGYCFIAPWLLGFALFTMFPVGWSLAMSFCHWDLISGETRFTGLSNVQQIVLKDTRFWQSLRVTLLFVVMSVPLSIMGSLLLALLLNQPVRGIRIFRAIFFLPAVLSGVAFSYLWVNVFNPEIGIINAILTPIYDFLHVSRDHLPRWIYGVHTALPSIVMMGFWGIGPGTITYLAGLQGIPGTFYEAAQIDGAGVWIRFRHITLPMLSPVILFNAIMGIIGSFQVFTQGYVMTGGGPQDSTLFYVLYLWQVAFQEFRGGYASALAWLLFIVILGMSLLTFRVSRSRIYYGGN